MGATRDRTSVGTELSRARYRAMVGGLALSVSVAYGTLFYGFSVLITEGAAGSEFSTTVLAAGFGGSILTSAVCAPAIGRIADRRGVRGIIVAGAVLGGVGLAAFAAAQQPWHVLVVWWAILGPATAMTFYEPAYVCIDQWCPDVQRATAIGVLTLFAGLSGPVSIATTTWLVEQMGWRDATAWLAAALVAVLVPVALVAVPRRPPAALGTVIPPVRRHDVVRSRRFVLFTAGCVLVYGAFEAMILHQIARFEVAGFALSTVSRWAVIAGIISLPGRFLLPRLGGTRNAAALLAGVAVLLSLATALAIGPSTDAELAGYFLLSGVVVGAALPLRAVAMAKWCSGPSFGWIMGVQAAWIGLARAAGPVVTGVARQHDGDGIAMAAMSVAFLAGAVLVLGSERRTSSDEA